MIGFDGLLNTRSSRSKACDQSYQITSTPKRWQQQISCFNPTPTERGQTRSICVSKSVPMGPPGVINLARVVPSNTNRVSSVYATPIVVLGVSAYCKPIP